jgi:thiamine-phosphate pyrophosphorylase
MAQKTDSRPKPRLYLATPPLTAAEAFAQQLTDATRDIDIAAVLLRLVPGDDAALMKIIDTLVPIVQQSGAALLIEGHVQIALKSNADGVHVYPRELKSSLERFKPDRIVGVGALHSRHDAMVAGEAGADYVLFGEPDATDERPATEAILERVAWWAELFEPPCVAYAATIEEAQAFAAAGADFVLLDGLVWRGPRDARAALMDAAAAISQNN